MTMTETMTDTRTDDTTQPTTMHGKATWLREHLDRLPARDHTFAQDIAGAVLRWGGSAKQQHWVTVLFDRAWGTDAGAGLPTSTARGIEGIDLSSIYNLFATARGHLKRPAIEIKVPGCEALVRISVGGERSKYRGQLIVTAAIYSPYLGGRPYWGRIDDKGVFWPTARRELPEGLVDGLKALAADPVRRVIEYGKHTGRCCFCRAKLGGETKSAMKSSAVGFGETCAKHYGLHAHWLTAFETLPLSEREAIETKCRARAHGAPRAPRAPRENASESVGSYYTFE